jgi:hypothetical protein
MKIILAVITSFKTYIQFNSLFIYLLSSAANYGVSTIRANNSMTAQEKQKSRNEIKKFLGI